MEGYTRSDCYQKCSSSRKDFNILPSAEATRFVVDARSPARIRVSALCRNAALSLSWYNADGWKVDCCLQY